MKPRRCRKCVYGVKVARLGRSVLLCINGENSAGRLSLTENTGSCRNFQPRERKINRPKVKQPDNDEIRFIPLTKGKFAIVDKADYEALSKYKWYTCQKASGFYAARHKNGKITYMHREILKPPPHLQVDHIDTNPLNNRSSNLRLCSPAQNIMNRTSKRGVSKYKGVHRHKNKWLASIVHNGRYIYLGCFDNQKDAAKAYDKKAKELFGEFAYLNLPQRNYESQASRRLVMADIISATS